MANQTTLTAFAPSAVDNPDAEAAWKLESLGYIFDGGSLDPRDETFGYGGADQVFRMDWSKPDGPVGTYEAFTANFKAFPEEYKGRRDRCGFRRQAGHQPHPVQEDRFLLKAAEGSRERVSFLPGSGYTKKEQTYLLEFTDGQAHTLTLYADVKHGNGYATDIKLVSMRAAARCSTSGSSSRRAMTRGDTSRGTSRGPSACITTESKARASATTSRVSLSIRSKPRCPPSATKRNGEPPPP